MSMPPRPAISTASVLLLVFAAGCRDFSIPTAAEPAERMTADVTAKIGMPFQLAPGQEARLDDRALVIAFETVLSDTRCRPGGPCNVTGDARILAEVRRDGGSTFPIELTIPGGVDSYYYYFGTMVREGEEGFRLLRLEPDPGTAVPVDPDAYRAFIVVQNP